MSRRREDLASTVKKLEETTEQLEQRATDAEQKVKQSEHALEVERKTSRKPCAAVTNRKRMSSATATAGGGAGKTHRPESRKIEQSASTSSLSPASNTPSTQPTSGAASLGRYLELASALGYDPSTDRPVRADA